MSAVVKAKPQKLLVSWFRSLISAKFVFGGSQAEGARGSHHTTLWDFDISLCSVRTPEFYDTNATRELERYVSTKDVEWAPKTIS